MSLRFGMVDDYGPSSVGHLPSSGQPSPRLLVRRLGRGVGRSSSGCNSFWPLVSGGGSSVYQREGAPCGGVRAPAFPASGVQLLGGSVCGQFDSSGLFPQAMGHPISSPQLHCSEDPPLGGVDRLDSGFPVHPGQEQCSSRLLVLPKPSPGVRVDSEVGGLSGAEQQVAGDDRPFCHLVESPLFTLFFTLPRSVGDRYGCASSELGRVSGVCLSTLVDDTAGSEEAPIILWGPYDSSCSLLAPETMISGPPETSGGRSDLSTSMSRSSQSTSFPLSSSRDRQAVPSCLETTQRFARSQGFSSRVAKQLGFARRSSSRVVHQSKWLVYRGWCRGAGHTISRPALPKIADFLLWLHRTRKLSVSAIMGYRSMLIAVFWFKLPEISTSPVLQDLLRSFQVAAPSRSIQPPSWDPNKVLVYLRSTAFEPLQSASLRALSKKTLFLMSLATAKRVSELQALSSIVSFSSEGAVVSYVPEFLAKTESALRPLPRSFLVKSLTDFATGLDEDLLLCPVRCLRVYLQCTAPGVNHPRRLFVSPKNPLRSISKNAISYFLQEIIAEAGASSVAGVVPRAHSIRGVATSTAFHRNWSITSIVNAACWRSSSVFTSFYLKDLFFEINGL